MQGACTTRTLAGVARASAAISVSAPASAQLSESHTLIVISGGGASPSFTTSK
jgi:hypothetical protein